MSKEMNQTAAHQSGWTIAEVVFGIPFLFSLGLQWIVPFSLPPGLLRQILLYSGIAFIFTGVVIIILARREFRRYGQPTDPGHPTSQVIQTGVFAISRNPLYLGSVAILLGIAWSLNLLWSLVTLLLSVVLCHHVLILPEEQYLAAKFGDEYQEYLLSVQRWLGRQ